MRIFAFGTLKKSNGLLEEYAMGGLSTSVVKKCEKGFRLILIGHFLHRSLSVAWTSPQAETCARCSLRSESLDGTHFVLDQSLWWAGGIQQP